MLSGGGERGARALLLVSAEEPQVCQHWGQCWPRVIRVLGIRSVSPPQLALLLCLGSPSFYHEDSYVLVFSCDYGFRFCVYLLMPPGVYLFVK